jgi:Transposase DDE domain group 1
VKPTNSRARLRRHSGQLALREGRRGTHLQTWLRLLACYLDESGDALAAKLRPGNAGSNTVVDHEDVLVAAVLHLPAGAQGSEILARADSSGASHGFIDRLREFDIRFSVGFDLTEPVRAEVLAIPENAWRPAITQAGEHREWADVCELQDLDLSAWPVRPSTPRQYDRLNAALTFRSVTENRG